MAHSYRYTQTLIAGAGIEANSDLPTTPRQGFGSNAGTGDDFTVALGNSVTAAGQQAIAIGTLLTAAAGECRIGNGGDPVGVNTFSIDDGAINPQPIKASNVSATIGINNAAGLWIVHRDNTGTISVKQILVDSVTGVLSVTP